MDQTRASIASSRSPAPAVSAGDNSWRRGCGSVSPPPSSSPSLRPLRNPPAAAPACRRLSRPHRANSLRTNRVAPSIILLTSGTEDIDPHYAYSDSPPRSRSGVYEMLIQLKGDSTDEFEPMLAESWEVSEDQSTYTFPLAPTPSSTTARRATPRRSRTPSPAFVLGRLPVNVISRFVTRPEQMEVVDATTIRFNLGTPQPLFLAAMASDVRPVRRQPDRRRREQDRGRSLRPRVGQNDRRRQRSVLARNPTPSPSGSSSPGSTTTTAAGTATTSTRSSSASSRRTRPAASCSSTARPTPPPST